MSKEYEVTMDNIFADLGLDHLSALSTDSLQQYMDTKSFKTQLSKILEHDADLMRKLKDR